MAIWFHLLLFLGFPFFRFLVHEVPKELHEFLVVLVQAAERVFGLFEFFTEGLVVVYAQPVQVTEGNRVDLVPLSLAEQEGRRENSRSSRTRGSVNVLRRYGDTNFDF